MKKIKENSKKMATIAQNFTNLTAEMSNQTFTGFHDVIEPKEGESQDFVSITKFMIIHLSLYFNL